MNIMKVHLFLFLLFRIQSVSSQSINQDSTWFRDNYYKIEKAISMWDGVKLFTSIYVPRDSTEKHPILMKELLTIAHHMVRKNTVTSGRDTNDIFCMKVIL